MKSQAKTALGILYKYSGMMRIQEALVRAAGGSFLTVLLFHRVTDQVPEDGLTVSTAWFRRLCGMIRRDFRAVPLGDIFRLARSGQPLPRRTLAITFDDCYRDNLFAARVLAEHGLPACFFIPSAYVGTDHVFPWDRGLPPMPNLSWDEVREMDRLGLEIGSHTVTHADMGVVSAEQARREIFDSKATLEKQLARKVRWFAYPFGGVGNFQQAWLPLLQEAGYEGCLSGYGGSIEPGTDPWILRREPVPHFRNNLNLELYLTGSLRWFHALKRCLGWQGKVPGGAAPSESGRIAGRPNSCEFGYRRPG